MMSSPKGHHFLPQFLLKGFASRIRGDQTYAFVYRKNSSPFETNIKNVAKVNYFHGKEDFVEGHLSSLESGYANLLDRLRVGQVRPEDQDLIGEFLAHMILRTKTLRENMGEFRSTMLAATVRFYADPKNDDVIRSMMRRLLYEELASPRFDSVRPLATTLGELQIQQPQFRDKCRELLNQLAYGQEDRRLAPGVQLKWLSDSGYIASRALAFAKFHWAVQFAKHGTFLLGDGGPLVQFNGHPLLRLAPINLGAVQLVIMPISENAILVGSPKEPTQQVSIEAANRCAAELSMDFFVSSCRAENRAEYAQAIGLRAVLLTAEDCDELVKQAIEAGR